MFLKKKLNNYKILILKKNFIKNEIKKLILKSIIYNQKIKPQVRAYAQFKQKNLKYTTHISRQFNTCIETGKNKSIINKFSRARQIVKMHATTNSITNTKIKSW